MQELVRKMKPTCYDDITAINALYRPGPLGAGMDEVFVDRKHGRKQIEYKHPDLEPILRDTYGVILYQEQVMQIAAKLGGFSLGMADKLRKAMGKKLADVMDEMKVKFLAGAAEKGYDPTMAGEVFEEMEFFAQYGFNKSHSAAYALLSIQTAWLKAHHPAEFMAATMTSEMRKSERIIQLIDECKVMGLRILPPSINQPRSEFGVDGDHTILFGMGAVKGVGAAAIQSIMACHEELGRPFQDIFDLCEHIDLQRVNRKVMESLIHAGALDELPGDRATLTANLDGALAFGQRAARDREARPGQPVRRRPAAAVALRPTLQAGRALRSPGGAGRSSARRWGSSCPAIRSRSIANSWPRCRCRRCRPPWAAGRAPGWIWPVSSPASAPSATSTSASTPGRISRTAPAWSRWSSTPASTRRPRTWWPATPSSCSAAGSSCGATAPASWWPTA